MTPSDFEICPPVSRVNERISALAPRKLYRVRPHVPPEERAASLLLAVMASPFYAITRDSIAWVEPVNPCCPVAAVHFATSGTRASVLAAARLFISHALREYSYLVCAVPRCFHDVRSLIRELDFTLLCEIPKATFYRGKTRDLCIYGKET